MNKVLALFVTSVAICVPHSTTTLARTESGPVLLPRPPVGVAARHDSQQSLIDAKKREHFAKARRILEGQNVPFDPDALLRRSWRSEIRGPLSEMPEMAKQKRLTGPLGGLILADTMQLGKVTDTSSDTVVITRRLQFDSRHAYIHVGSRALFLYVLDSIDFPNTGNERPSLYIDARGPGRAHGQQRPSHGSWSTSMQSRPRSLSPRVGNEEQDSEDVSATSERSRVRQQHTWRWTREGTYGADGDPGRDGDDGDAGDSGLDGYTLPCENGGSGTVGADGQPGKPGLNGFDGNAGQAGGNGGTVFEEINAWEGGDFYAYVSGGDGGWGGNAGKGGKGGAGGKGGNGGDGNTGCGFDTNGGNGGNGGDGAEGGNGGNGGNGGAGGDGGYISVVIHTLDPDSVYTEEDISGGLGGVKGSKGQKGASGTGGSGGNGGLGFGGGTSGSPGTSGSTPLQYGGSGEDGQNGTDGSEGSSTWIVIDERFQDPHVDCQREPFSTAERTNCDLAVLLPNSIRAGRGIKQRRATEVVHPTTARANTECWARIVRQIEAS